MRRWNGTLWAVLWAITLVGCGGGERALDGDTQVPDDARDLEGPGDHIATPDGVAVEDASADGPSGDAAEVALPNVGTLVVATFNTGTSLKPPDGAENQGFGKQQAQWCDEYYGNGLAWKAFVQDARTWIESVSPDLIVFQEIFYSEECPTIPEEARVGFVCEAWSQGDPTVVQLVTGPDYQVMCNPGKPDKCAAVHERLGRFAGCSEDFCLEGMAGYTVEGCGKGARIGRGVVELAAGGTLTLVSVHGSSGFALSDSECRIRQFDQIFVDLGDGQPAANGAVNLIMGDFNTDPGEMTASDPSAAHLVQFVGQGKAFHFVTGVGPESEKTYGGFFTIDHVISDRLDGSCWTAGVTQGHPTVSQSVGFDHHPTVCTVK